MKHDKELLAFKLLAVAAVLLYVYKLSQKSGGSLAQNPYGVNINADKIVGLASQFVPREYREHARQMGSAVLNRFMH